MRKLRAASSAIKKESKGTYHLQQGAAKARCGVGSCQIIVCFCRICKNVIVWVVFLLCWCEDVGSQDGFAPLSAAGHTASEAVRGTRCCGEERGEEGRRRRGERD